MSTIEIPYNYNRLKCVNEDVDLLSCVQDGGNSFFNKLVPIIPDAQSNKKIPLNYFDGSVMRLASTFKTVEFILYVPRFPSGLLRRVDVELGHCDEYKKDGYYPLMLVGHDEMGVTRRNVYFNGFEITHGGGVSGGPLGTLYFYAASDPVLSFRFDITVLYVKRDPSVLINDVHIANVSASALS